MSLRFYAASHRRSQAASLVLALFFTLLFSTLLPQRAQAASFVVDTTSDTNLTACTGAAGDCSLRGAINAANTLAGTDSITFDATVYTSAATGTITLTSDLPDISTSMNITGLGATLVIVDGANNYQPFNILSSTTVNLGSLTVTHGSASLGGGLHSQGTVTVTNSTFSENTATTSGGGIYNDIFGTLNVINSTFSSNSAAFGGGGIFTQSTLTVTNSTFSGNSAPNGGGIFANNSSILIVTNSTFASNSTSGGSGGGGILNNGGATSTVTNSTFSGNSAPNGGGIFDNGGTLTVINSTFSANTATTNGGGIYNGGTLTVTNSTLSANSATSGGGIYHIGTTFNLKNSIVANSISGGNCSRISGTLNAQNSLIEGGLACVNGTNTNNLTGDPALVNDTTDLRLQSSSIAINAGDNSLLPADTADLDGDSNTAEPLPIDLAGNSRIFNTTVDMGAFEVQPAVCPASPFIYTVVAGDVADLIFAINCANTGAGNDTINLTNSTYTITSQLTLLNSGTLTINGNSATINRIGGAAFRIFFNNAATVILNDLTISGGSTTSGGGGIATTGTLTLNNSTVSGNSAVAGGGIDNAGTLTLTNSTVSGNSATNSIGGGGIHNTGAVTLTNSMVSGNSASVGGGIATLGGTLTITGSTFSGNSGVSNGGGINTTGGNTLTITGSTFSGNSAAFGGGIFTNGGGGTLTITGSTFSGNSAVSGGGAIINENTGTTTTVVNSTFNGNSVSAGNGGGIYGLTGTLKISNSTFSANSASGSGGGLFNASTLVLNNSIVANSTHGGDCSGVPAASVNHTLIEDGSCGVGTGPSYANSNLSGDPSLGALSLTSPAYYPLLNTSIAINAGDNALAVDATNAPLTTDQPGNARIFAGQVDMGAYEAQQADCPAFPYTVPASSSGLLEFAIACANGNGAGTNDTINLTNSTYTLTVVNDATNGGNGLPVIADAATSGTLVINGNGATITRDGSAPQFRIFNLSLGANLTFDSLTVSGGSLSFPNGGGGILNNTGTLTITNSTVSTNTAYVAGGIYNNSASTLAVTNSIIRDNTATNNSGGIFNDITSTVTVTNSTVTGNMAPSFGGIYNRNTMTLINSTVSGNIATDSVGGINNIDTLTIINSTISGNTAANASGGIASINTLTIINSTVANNTATAQPATSGINNQLSGSVTLQNSIVANNNGANNCNNASGTFTDNGHNLDNGTSCGFGATSLSSTNPLLDILQNNGGTTETLALLSGSPAINAGDNALAVDATNAALTTDQRGTGFPRIFNTTVDIGAFESAFAPAVPTVTVSPAAFNVAEGSNADFTITRTGSTASALVVTLNITQGTDTLLTDYTLTGGTISGQTGSVTATIPAGSASVNVNFAALIDSAGAEADNTLTLDLVDGAAYDLGAIITSTATIAANDFFVTTTNDSGEGSLRQAITNANNIAGTDTITFDPTVFNPGTITLTSALPDISTSMNITGLGATLAIVDGANNYQPFNILSSTTVNLSGLTVTHGLASFGGGGIFNNGGTLTVTNSTFSSNSAAFGGGGIYNGGTLTVTNSTFSSNSSNISSSGGGGIFNDGGSTTTVTNSTFSDNSAPNGGAILDNGGTSIVINSTISENTATINGGGIYNGGTVTLKNSIIANSTSGGDCVLGAGTVNAQNSLIEDGLTCVNGTNTNNLTGDPALVNDLTDLSLQSGSIAINAGDNSLLPTDTYDLDGDSNTAEPLPLDLAGNPRIIGGTVDMGAFESGVIPTPLLSATKTVSGIFEIGQTVIYTVVISNSGTGAQPDNAGNEFNDVLPAQLALISANATSGTAVATVATNTVTWNGSIPAGSSLTITITATLSSGTTGQTVSNQGTVAYDSDLNGSNETSTQTDDPGVGGASDPTSFVIVAPAVSVSKTATDLNSGSLVPGDTLRYTVTITNTGTGDAFNTVLTDAIPANTTYVANSTTLNAGAVADVAGAMPYVSGASVGTVAKTSGTAVVVFDVTVNNPLPAGVTEVRNDASVTADALPTPATNFVTSPMTPTSGLSLSKDDGVADVAPGAVISYTLSYQNTGNIALDNVTLTDIVPANTTFDAADSSAGWVCTPDSSAGSVCTLNVGTVAGGASDSKTFAVTVASTIPSGVTEIANSAGVSSSATNASADEHTLLTGFAPAVTAAKTASDTNGGVLLPGDTLEYTIIVTNNGNTPALNVVLTDAIPANTTYIANSTTLNTVAVPDVAGAMPFAAGGSLGDIAAGASATVVFDVTINNPLPNGVTQVENTGTVTGDNFSSTPTNTAASPVVTGLTITKAFAASHIASAETTNLRFTLTNPAGNPALTGLTFSDVLPNGLVFSGTPTAAQCAGTVSLSNAFTLNFSGGSLGAGLSTCTIDAVVKADGTVTGQLNNLSSIVSADGGIVSASGASASLSVDVGPTPIPARFFECQNLGTQSGGSMTSTGGIGAVHSGDVSGNVYCHIIGKDGHYVTESAEIGIQSVIDLGVQQAVDVFGELPNGSSVVPLDRPVQICLRGTGEVLFLNAANARRTVERLTVVDLNGYLCVQVTGSGTVVLVRQTSGAPQLPAPATPAPQSVELANCRVTTTHAPLNLRAEPSASAAILAQLPYALTLTATEHVPGWYRVIYLNGQGWVSASFVSTAGDCGQ